MSGELERLNDIAGAVVWEADDAWALHLSFVSEAAVSLVGFPAEQWRAERGFLEKHVHPDDWKGVLETLYRAASTDGWHTCVHRMVKADGSTLWAQTSVHRTTTPEGAGALRGVTVDVTALKTSELALREGESMYHHLVDDIRDYAVFRVSVDGRIESWNRGAERLKAYRSEEIIGQPLARFFAPDEIAQATPERLLASAERDGRAEYEGWLVRGNGERFWGNLVLNALTNRRGQLRGFANIARDLTERKRAEGDLRAREAQLRQLVDSVQDHALFMVSVDGRIETWNRGARRLQGHRAPEIVGASIERFFPPDEIERGTPARLLAEAARAGQVDYEGWLVRADDSRFWALLTLIAVEEADGRLRGFSYLARDATERRRVEVALQESERHFRLLVDSVRDQAIFMLSVDGRVESWNPGAQRVKGFRAHEILGQTVEHFFPADEVREGTPRSLLERARVHGQATYEGWLVRGGVERFWGVVTLSAVEDEQGRLQGFANVARDVTESRRAQEALRESEERLRLLIDSLQDYGVFMLTPEGRVESWSPGAERLKGYRAEEVLGKSAAMFFPAEEIERGTAEGMLRTAAKVGRAEYEGWLERKNGSTFWASLIFSAVRDERGELRGFSNVGRDLTERMRSERAQAFLSNASAALAASLDYRTTLERVARLATRELAASCIIHVLDGDVLEPVAVAHVDPEREAVAREALRRLPADAGLPYGVAQVVQSGRAEIHAEVSDVRWLARSLGADVAQLPGATGPVSYISAPMTARGRTFGTVTFLASATRRRYDREDLQLAEELARRAALAVDNALLYTEAQRAIRMREDVLAIVTHDLRGPLRTIDMNASLLIDPEHEEPAAELVAHIQRATMRMDRMIRDLLDFSSIQSGRLTLDLRAHDVADVLSEAVQAWRPVAEEKGISLDAGAAEGLRVRCDRLRVAQLLENLVGNAVKFTAGGGSIRLDARAEADEIVVSVTDTGTGITPENLPHVFDRYWRVNARAPGSFGLGLAIARGIVEAHGGHIWVESEPGRGSTFSFTLAAVR